MTPQFRNVRLDPAAPVREWPAEAIETMLERGTLSDWRRLAEEIRAEPWGRVARYVERAASWGEHDGVDALMAAVIVDARRQLDRRARLDYAARIRGWRRAAGMSLRELARAAGTSASRMSDYENAKVAPTTDVLGRLEYVTGRARDRS